MPLYSVMECSFLKCQKSLTLFSPIKRLPSLVLWLGSGNCLPRLNQGKNLEVKQLNCFLTLKQLSSLWSHLYSQFQVLGPPIPELLGVLQEIRVFFLSYCQLRISAFSALLSCLLLSICFPHPQFSCCCLLSLSLYGYYDLKESL